MDAMKQTLAGFLLVLLGLSACAHNPRPESPEQRAERQAQSLQEQQNSQSAPRSTGYSTRADEDRDSGNEQARSEPQQPANQQTRAQVHQQAAAIRNSARSMGGSVSTGVTSVTGGMLR